MLLMPLPKKQDKCHGDSKTLELLHEIQGEGSHFSITLSEKFPIRKNPPTIVIQFLFIGRRLIARHLFCLCQGLSTV